MPPPPQCKAGTTNPNLDLSRIRQPTLTKTSPCGVVKSAFLPVPAEFDRLRVVLVSTRNPLNIGAAARAMSNFGFSRLRLVNPYSVAYREARSAVGASSVLASAEQFKDLAEAVADC